jgi:hypothetical protein
MGKKIDSNVIEAEFEILIHPDLPLEVKEVEFNYALSGRSDYQDYLANKVNEKKYVVTIYDLPLNAEMDFYIKFIKKDGEIILGKKENKNYRVQIKDNAEGKYKAQIRITEQNLMEVGRKCLVCGEVLKKGTHICQKCDANYCPKCTRMLPPRKDYCPWCKMKIE